jgi:hypothetical protein
VIKSDEQKLICTGFLVGSVKGNFGNSNGCDSEVDGREERDNRACTHAPFFQICNKVTRWTAKKAIKEEIIDLRRDGKRLGIPNETDKALLASFIGSCIMPTCI